MIRRLDEDTCDELVELALARAVDEHAVLDDEEGFIARLGCAVAVERDGQLSGWLFGSEEEASSHLALIVNYDPSVPAQRLDLPAELVDAIRFV